MEAQTLQFLAFNDVNRFRETRAVYIYSMYNELQVPQVLPKFSVNFQTTLSKIRNIFAYTYLEFYVKILKLLPFFAWQNRENKFSVKMSGGNL